MRGAFALAFLFDGEDDLLIGARQGAPLAVGYGTGEMYLGSDALALAPFTDLIAYLEEGDWVALTREGAVFRDASGEVVKRRKVRSQAGSLLIEKGNYRHFMAKEIHEQPEVVGHTLAHYVDMARARAHPSPGRSIRAKLTRLTICACGTAYMAGLAGKYWIERYARLPVEIDVASEYRYREAPVDDGGRHDRHFAIGRDRRHAGLAALRQGARQQGRRRRQRADFEHRAPQRRVSRRRWPDRRSASPRPRRSPASSRRSPRWRSAWGARAGRSMKRRRRRWSPNCRRPGLLAQALKLEPAVETIAHSLARARDVLYLGRGTSYPLALEGALKLKELSYIHAEGYAAGELKHGPIALIDEAMPVIVIAPRDAVFEKTVSNMQEVAARGGRIILIGDQNAAAEAAVDVAHFLPMPDMGDKFAPIVYAAPSR